MQTSECTVFRWLFSDQNFTINHHTPFFSVSGYELCNEDIWMIHAARYPGQERSWDAIAHALEYSANMCLSEQRVFYIDHTRPPRGPIEPKDVENEYKGCLHLLRHIPAHTISGPAPDFLSFHKKLLERFWLAFCCYTEHKNKHPW